MISDPLIIHALIMLVTGIGVGFACGLLGVGGGFIMVPVQIWSLTSMGIDPTLATRIAFGTSLAVVLPTALSGCHSHSCKGVVLWQPGIVMGLSGLVGGFIGGTAASHMPGDLLKMIFGLVVLLGALRMMFADIILLNKDYDRDPPRGPPKYAVLGFLVGTLSGLCGIGGGVILVPMMVILLGFSIYQAIGTSSIAIALNAVGGILAYIINGWGMSGLSRYSLGYIDLLQFSLLAGASVVSASWGAKAAHKLPADKLKYIFVILMIYISLQMIGIFSWGRSLDQVIGPGIID